MAASDVDIANDALTLLGAGRITSFEEEGTQAKVMLQMYQPAVDAVLQSHPWNSALVQAELPQLSSVTPVYGYDYAYQLPVDPVCLRVLEVYDNSKHSLRSTSWKKVGTKIYTDRESVMITYVARVNAADIDPLLRAAIAGYLAYSAAYTLVQSNTVQGQMFQIYQQRLQEARTVNRLETVGNRTYSTQLNDVRGSGNYSSRLL